MTMNDDSVVSPTPPDGGAPVATTMLVEPTPARPVWWMAFGAFTFLIAGCVAAGFFIKTDSVALVPGSARDTEALVEIEGAESFPSDGEILLTTVRLRQPLSVWEQLWLGLSDDNELLPREAVFGDRTADENTEVNLQLMADSKEVAVAVALEQLGYDAISSDGVFVTSIAEGSAAEGVLTPGEIIERVNDTPTPGSGDLVDAIAAVAPGSSVELHVRPIGETEVRIDTVVLGARDDDPDRAFLGIGLADNLQFEAPLDFDVDIDTGEVGGPSAGLAFSLAVLDQLTPGELTGGADVAVTGTIRADGSVGPIGGLPQKAAAVRDRGLETFIVPAASSEEDLALARELAGDDLVLFEVESLEEALEALGAIGGDVEAIESFAAANPDAGS